MNSLSLGFFYVVGFSWILCETSVSAASGNWGPLVLFTIGFILMFSILGCLPISNRAVGLAGPVFGILTGLGIIAYAGVYYDGGIGASEILRVLGGGLVVAVSVIGFGYADKKEAH